MSTNMEFDGERGRAKSAARAFEAAADRLRDRSGVGDEEIALGLLAAALTRLSAVWPPERVVGQLSGITGALMDVHSIDPETGEPGLRPTRN